MAHRPSVVDNAQCSFCLHKSEHAGLIVASPHPPRAYICQECISVSIQLIEDYYLERAARSQGAPEDIEKWALRIAGSK